MTPPALERRHRPHRFAFGELDPLARATWSLLAILAFSVAFYCVTLLVRPTGTSWTWLDGWAVSAMEVVASVICIGRSLVARPGRLAALFLGLAVLSWSVGDVVLTFEGLGGSTPFSPSWADACYLAFYPIAAVGIGLFVHQQARSFTLTNWLDGAIAGLGTASICSVVLFQAGVPITGPTRLATLVKLAYPLGDALLLGLVVGGFAALSGLRKTSWILLASAMVLNIFGDSSNLLAHSFGATRAGYVLNAIAWPVAILLAAMAVWLRRKPPNPLSQVPSAGFTLPLLGTLGALGLLVAGNLTTVESLPLALAIATLIVVVVRFVLSVRGMEQLSHQRHQQAITDELTGLWNRRYLFRTFDTYFAEAAKSDSQEGLAFLFIDLDKFKEINDSFGHPAGDELLRQLAGRLKSALRDDDLIVRVGGDEFGVVLAGASTSYAAEVAERLTESLTKPFELESVTACIGASIGIAHAPEDASDSARLIWCADVAMYRAKQGRLPYVHFLSSVDDEQDQMRLVAELDHAIDAGQLVLYYQPQLDLRTRQIDAVEALIRWEHPRMGLVPPDVFLPLAQEAGLMQRITAWVLDTGLAQCAAWLAEGKKCTVSLNITPDNLLERGFVDLVSAALVRHQVPAECLVLEITETSVIHQFDVAQGIIEDLRDRGVDVSIDDFGAGVTSLAYLSDLAVRELKLDRAFINRITEGNGPHDLDLVRSTIELGHAMGLRIVAEGIEDPGTLELLAGWGCDIAQGYCISRPRPAEQLQFGPVAPAVEPVASTSPVAAKSRSSSVRPWVTTSHSGGPKAP